MISCEGTGKTLEQAIENALFELKASREDVDIKVINEGGFLKKAKVVVTISEDAREKYEKREKLKKEEEAKEAEEAEAKKVEEKKVKKTDIKEEDFSENFMKKKISKTEEKEKNEEKQKENAKVVDKAEKSEPNEEKIGKRVSPKDFLEKVLDAMGLEAQIERTEDGQYVKYSLVGENLNGLIGHHGDCLNSMEQLLRIACFEEDHKKILLDVDGYRIKRAESLTALAQRVADKVAKTGRYHKFEPMTASERKIIHTALQADDRVTTLSKGEEPQRFLIVFPKEYKD